MLSHTLGGFGIPIVEQLLSIMTIKEPAINKTNPIHFMAISF
jgi:hypothetical protein